MTNVDWFQLQGIVRAKTTDSVPMHGSDGFYWCPSLKWVRGQKKWWRWPDDLWGDYSKLITFMNMGTATRQWDCDKYAKTFQLAGAAKFARENKDPGNSLYPESPAIGIFSYVKTAGPHAINIVVLSDKTVTFWEKGWKAELSKKEISSCFDITF